MNQKVLAVMRRILEHPEKIEEIVRSGNEYFFRYGSHFFSVAHRAKQQDELGPWSFYVYPNWKGLLSKLANAFDFGDDDTVAMVSYHSAQFEEPDEERLFRDLYLTVESRYLNVDKVFDDILGTEHA